MGRRLADKCKRFFREKIQEMNKLDHALSLAAKGFHVFPLVPNSKVPLKEMENFPEIASNDPEVVRKWWTDYPSANIAISTTKYNGSGALLAVDVDNKNGVSGDDTLFGFELDGLLLPKTFTQHTPTGGKHLLYFCSRPVRNSAKKLGKGIDTRGQGGYVVGAGSTIGGIPYTFDEAPLAEAPAWLVEKCGEAKPKQEKVAAIEGVNLEFAVKRAIFYLENEAFRGIEGSRNGTAFAVAAKIKDYGVPEDQCFLLMTERWECSPPLDSAELESVVRSAYKYADNPYGALAPEAVFTPSVPEKEAVPFYLDEINKEYALLYEDGGHVVMKEIVDNSGAKRLKMFPEATFNRIYSHLTVQEMVGDKLREIPYSKKWLNWAGRREYQGLCFSPGKQAPEGYYNLWFGFRVEPLPYERADMLQRAGFDAFMDHAKTNVCAGNDELFQWLMGYFAQMIQKPYERPLTTLVFQGRKGTGKNTLVDRVGFLLRDHYKVADDSRYLTSNFNGHLDNCLMLVLDEAFWSGDKSAEGKLKGITTSPRIMIERKGKEPYMVDNLVRLVVIGNEEWLVPASADERRYAVFKMGEGRMQDTKYFSEMARNMDVYGGCRVLLDYLQNFDLTKVDPNIAPKTEGLLAQKIESLGLFGAWWHECLSSGSIYGGEWPLVVDKSHLLESYRMYAKGRRGDRWLLDTRMAGRILREYCPSTVTDSQRRDGKIFIQTFKLPTLEVARAEWVKYLGDEIDWSKQ